MERSRNQHRETRKLFSLLSILLLNPLTHSVSYLLSTFPFSLKDHQTSKLFYLLSIILLKTLNSLFKLSSLSLSIFSQSSSPSFSRSIALWYWKQFEDVNEVIRDYVFLLNIIPLRCFENKIVLDVDLGVLKMLQDLDHHTRIPDDLRKWIKSQLTEDWDETLKFTNFMEEELKKRAEKDVEDVHLLIQTVNLEPIEVNNINLVDLVECQFMSYSKEIADASRDMEDNLTIYVHALEMCQSVKKLVQFLKVVSSLMLHDDMEVDEEIQGIHRSLGLILEKS